MHRAARFMVLSTLALACGESQEAPRVTLPVKIGAPIGLTTTNDTGWTVTVTSFRQVIADLEFTIEGEAHVAQHRSRAWFSRLSRLLVPEVHAHPGHLAGGEATGALPGVFTVDWATDVGRVLGNAELIAGTYNGVNLSLGRGNEMLATTDPLRASTALVSGTATREGVTLSFTATLLVDAGSRVFGAPLTTTVGTQTTGSLAIALVLADPVSGKRFFDKVDFAPLDPDGDGQVTIVPGTAEGNTLRRPLQDHVHYTATPEL